MDGKRRRRTTIPGPPPQLPEMPAAGTIVMLVYTSPPDRPPPQAAALAMPHHVLALRPQLSACYSAYAQSFASLLASSSLLRTPKLASPSSSSSTFASNMITGSIRFMGEIGWGASPHAHAGLIGRVRVTDILSAWCCELSMGAATCSPSASDRRGVPVAHHTRAPWANLNHCNLLRCRD